MKWIALSLAPILIGSAGMLDMTLCDAKYDVALSQVERPADTKERYREIKLISFSFRVPLS
jgi:hypothetical protein